MKKLVMILIVMSSLFGCSEGRFIGSGELSYQNFVISIILMAFQVKVLLT